MIPTDFVVCTAVPAWNWCYALGCMNMKKMYVVKLVTGLRLG